MVSSKRILMNSLVESELNKAYIRMVAGINRALLVEDKKNKGNYNILTEGLNLK